MAIQIKTEEQRVGWIKRHKPHQGAQKCTRTGLEDSKTSLWKLFSFTDSIMSKQIL